MGKKPVRAIASRYDCNENEYFHVLFPFMVDWYAHTEQFQVDTIQSLIY